MATTTTKNSTNQLQTEYGIVFVTTEETRNEEENDYQGKFMGGKMSGGRNFLLELKSKKNEQDSIVTDETREIHVCVRRDLGQYYTYYGKLYNKSKLLCFNGNEVKSEPDGYTFQLDTENVKFKTLLTGALEPQAQAVESLGFFYNGNCCGAHKMWASREAGERDVEVVEPKPIKISAYFTKR
jgi:hypothetical protein